MADSEEQTAFQRLAMAIHPGARLVRSWQLDGGVSARVDALEIALPDDTTQRVVVRRHGATDWKPLEADVTTTEFALLKILHGANFAVPAPRLLDASGTILPSPYTVMAFVDGSTEVAPRDLPGALRQMASFLTRLHALDVEALDLPALPRREDPWPNMARYLPDTQLGDRIRAAHARHGPIVPANPAVLLHGDFWPGNILWRAGEIAAVLDWEDTAIGDPLADLAGARVELLWRHGPEMMETFTAHYLAKAMVDIANLPFWELMVASAGAKYMGNWDLDPKTEADMRAKSAWVTEDALRRIAADR